MTRWVLRLLGAFVLLALTLVPALGDGSGNADQPVDTARITNYQANFTLAENGDLVAQETLDVDFGGASKHGIFRFFDTVDASEPRVRLKPRDLTVTRDGNAEEFDLLSEGGGRYLNAKIGSAYTTITGPHQYVISYKVEGAISKGSDGSRSQFYWNLIPGGWRMPIERSELTVTLPATAEGLQCAVGAGATSGCESATGDGTNTLAIRTGQLAPNTPVTIKTGLDVATPDRDTALFPWRWQQVFGRTPLAILAALLLGAVAAFLGARTASPTREKTPAFPLMYGPPEGLGPAEGRYLLTEKTGNEAFVASLLEASEKGVTTLSRDDGWTISPTGDHQAMDRLDPVTAFAVQKLGATQVPFRVHPKDVKAGEHLKSTLSSFDSTLKHWATSNRLMTTAGLGLFGGVLVVGAVLLTGFMIIVAPVPTILALIPGLFAIFGLEVLMPGASTKRTAEGRELWSRLGGFRRILATPSSEARFDFSGRKELYTAFIPWAVAFDCADNWAEKYRMETATEPPVPTYFYGGGWGYGGPATMVSQMSADFSSTVSSAISAYQATQSSSGGGGGGGFSGGGGGGGGGGGSW